MTAYAANPDTIISPRVILILATLVWVLALIDISIDAVFPRDRREHQG
jgi:hypothetical protein